MYFFAADFLLYVIDILDWALLVLGVVLVYVVLIMTFEIELII